MEPKAIKNLIENRFDFCNDFETTFSRYWVDVGSKNLSKMRGLNVSFSTLLRICEKCDFKQHFYGFAPFSDFRRVDFRFENVYFSVVFSNAILRRTFFDFWLIFYLNWNPNGNPNR